MTPSEIVSQIRETTASILWRQWKGIGAMTNERDAQAIVDPEALLLVSLLGSELEPRLPGVLRSWIWENAELLSITRLKNLLRLFPEVPGLEEIAHLGIAAGDRRWATFLAGSATATPPDRPKGRAVAAPMNQSAALMLRLRVGLGNTARADVLTYLLGLAARNGERWASVADMAEALCYTPASVRQLADEMARARLIEQLPGVPAGRGPAARLYRARPGGWQGLLGNSVTQWHDWKDTYLFVLALDGYVRSAPAGTVTEYVLWSKFRELLGRHPKALPSHNSEPHRPPLDAEDWPAYVVERVQQWHSWAANAA